MSYRINKLKSNVYFYSLEETDDVNLCLCQLVKKLYKENKNIIIIDNNDRLTDIDKLLWSFEQNSFLPHKIIIDDENIDSPILLVSYQNINKLDVIKNNSEIINNSELPLTEYKTYINIHEFVSNDEEHKKVCRAKYSKYMNNNFDVIHRKYDEQAI